MTTEKLKSTGQPKFAGYRELSAAEIALIQDIKALGTNLDEMSQRLTLLNIDQRWVSIGRTDLQTGLMAWVRAVAQPEFF